MKNLLFALFALLFVSGQAHATIVCSAQTSMGPAKIAISDNQVVITGAALTEPEIFENLSAVWDGHETELITAPGLSVSYHDDYGCIHRARVTANFRTSPGFIETIEIPGCSGGSTPDHTCHVSSPSS